MESTQRMPYVFSAIERLSSANGRCSGAENFVRVPGCTRAATRLVDVPEELFYCDLHANTMNKLKFVFLQD
jgi:hypothetical protein